MPDSLREIIIQLASNIQSAYISDSYLDIQDECMKTEIAIKSLFKSKLPIIDRGKEVK